MQLPSKQRGMGWFGLMLMFMAIGFFALVGMKCWPLLLNEMKVTRAIKAAAQDPASRGDDPQSVRKALGRYWDVDDIDILEVKDVKVTNVPGTGRVLAYDYWAQVNLFSNVYVSFNFKKEEPFPKSGF